MEVLFVPDFNKLISVIAGEDRGVLFEFFLVFSRFEYAAGTGNRAIIMATSRLTGRNSGGF
jgi:hypothetical protein